MNTLQRGMLSLIHSAITGEKNEIPSDFDFLLCYNYAKAHRILPLVYHGIICNKIKLEEQLKNKFFMATYQAIAVAHKQKDFLEKISAEFEKENIDYMPLKGSIIKDLFPKLEMRPMGDLDILFKFAQYGKIVPILERMNLKFVKENENELSWKDYPLYVEFHRYLVSPQHEDYFKYFGDGWQFAKKAENKKNLYVMKDEDYYVYLFAHLTKHYRFSGIGIKHLVDIWVYLNAKPNLDMEYIEEKLEQIGISLFHKNIVKTVRCWFDGEAEDEVCEIITKKVFGSGAFGTGESAKKAAAVKTRENSKVNNLFLSRTLYVLFPPYKNMCLLFPVLKKAAFLLPFMWIWRIVYTVLFKKGRVKAQYSGIKNTSMQEIDDYANELKAVGLDYKFKE